MGPTGPAGTYTAGSTANGSIVLLSGSTIKNLKATAPIQFTATTNEITIAGDTYSKAESDTALALKANLATPSFTGNVSIGGDLSVTGFYARKPWVGYTMSAAGSLSAPIGYNTTGISVSHTAATEGYTVTMPAHPSGTAYHVNVSVFTNTNTSDVVAIPTVKIVSSTSFIVWLRSALGTGTARTEGIFYFHTVP
jgi:hypothetical protein